MLSTIKVKVFLHCTCWFRPHLTYNTLIIMHTHWAKHTRYSTFNALKMAISLLLLQK